jgi:hypothetical protein
MQSQLIDVLQGARNPLNLAECIYMANNHATSKRIKLICDWISAHLKFNEELRGDARLLNDIDYITKDERSTFKKREDFDRTHFLLNEKGKKMYNQLKDILKVGPSILSDPLFKPKKKNYFEDKMKKINNKELSAFTQDELSNTFNIVIMDEIKNILDPFAEVTRHKKYHTSIDELCSLYDVTKFLEIHPFEWHIKMGILHNQNEKNLLSLYPVSQFEYFNIPQKIYPETCPEIILYHIVNNTCAKINSEQVNDEEDTYSMLDYLKKIYSGKYLDFIKFSNTNTNKDLFDIILLHNFWINNIISSNDPYLSNYLKPWPKNYSSLFINYRQNLEQNRKRKIFSTLRKLAECYKFESLKMYEYILIILAYHSSEGQNQRSYREAFMDNPDPRKQCEDGVLDKIITNFNQKFGQYKDEYGEVQYSGFIEKIFIEHYMP